MVEKVLRWGNNEFIVKGLKNGDLFYILVKMLIKLFFEVRWKLGDMFNKFVIVVKEIITRNMVFISWFFLVIYNKI